MPLSTRRQTQQPPPINFRIAREIARKLHILDIEVRPPCPVLVQKGRHTAWDFRISFTDSGRRRTLLDSGARFETHSQALDGLRYALMIAWRQRRITRRSHLLTRPRIRKILECFTSPGFGLLVMEKYLEVPHETIPIS